MDTERLSLIHLIVKECPKHPISEVLDFLCKVPHLEELSSQVSGNGSKTGHCYPKEANSILCAACQCAINLSIVYAMLEAGADVNMFDEQGVCPLMHAAQYGSSQVIRMLLSYGADVNLCNTKNENSMFVACSFKQWKAAKMLYNSGVDAFSALGGNQAPIQVAVCKEGVDFVQYIASANPIFMRNLLKSIPLPYACKLGYDSVVASYDINTLDQKTIKSAAYEACMSKNTDILRRFSTKLYDATGLVHWTYQHGYFDSLNVLLECCEVRPHMHFLQIPLSKHANTAPFINSHAY